MPKGFIVAFGMSWDSGPRFYVELVPDPTPTEEEVAEVKAVGSILQLSEEDDRRLGF